MKTKKDPELKNVHDFSLIHWFTLIGVSCFILFFPYQRALFNSNNVNFESPIYESMLVVFSLMLFGVAHLFRVWRLDNSRAILSISILLMPFIYWLSSFNAASVHNAQLMTLIYCMYAAFFIFGLYLVSTPYSRITMENVLMLAGYGVVVFGLLNAFGQVYYPFGIWFTSGEYRLSSVFQYSNTYAGFLMAIFICSLYLAATSKKLFPVLLHSFMLVPIWISFMLTYSRGALVFVPLLVLVTLLFLRFNKQLILLATLILSIGASFVILGKITDIYIRIAQLVQPQVENGPGKTISLWNTLALQEWLQLLLVSLVVSSIVGFMHVRSAWIESKLETVSCRRFSVVFIPFLFIALGLALVLLFSLSNALSAILPASIADRLANINLNQHSVLERKTFYMDAMKVVRDYPLLGAGGGGWSVLYEKYQNNPYISKQAHSFFVQTLVEVGLIGFIILIGVIAASYYFYVKGFIQRKEQQGSHLIFLLFSLAIFLHSLIDFDMSFVYLGSIVFLALGAMVATFPHNMSSTKEFKFSLRPLRYVFPSVIGLFSVILLIWSYREYVANSSFSNAVNLAVKEHKPLEQLLPPINRAIRLSPENPAYSLMKADWMSQAYRQTGNPDYLTEVNNTLSSLSVYEPYNRDLILAEYRYYKDTRQYDLALASLEEGLLKFQWDINFYEAAILEYRDAGHRIEAKAPSLAKKNWSRGIALYHEVLRRMELLKDLPKEQMQGRDFSITAPMQEAIDQMNSKLES